jgi:hypothetical protein
VGFRAPEHRRGLRPLDVRNRVNQKQAAVLQADFVIGD